MKSKFKLEKIKIEDLILDKDNPRFAELYDWSSDEKSIIDYLLYSESAKDLAKSIINEWEFWEEEPLFVIEKKWKFLVKDWNRRCSAAKAIRLWLFDQNKNHSFLDYLPALIYVEEKELDKVIARKHTANNLFKRRWRLAKALRIYEIFRKKSSEDELSEIDSNRPEYVRLASFYYEAVKIWWSQFKMLLRKERTPGKGKTEFVKRLFSVSKKCWYVFKKKPTYTIEITNQVKFESYINALVKYFQDFPKQTYRHVEKIWNQEQFLIDLEDYWFNVRDTHKKWSGLFKNLTTRDSWDNWSASDSSNNQDSWGNSSTSDPLNNQVTWDSWGNSSISDSSNNQDSWNKGQRRTKEEKTNQILFWKKLILKQWQVNNLYCAIMDIFNKFSDDQKILPIIGMSLRLILDLAAKNYYKTHEPSIIQQGEDALYKKFCKLAQEMLSKDKSNYLAITNWWLNKKDNFEARLGKYAHYSILYTKNDILNDSIIVWDILNFYFSKN